MREETSRLERLKAKGCGQILQDRQSRANSLETKGGGPEGGRGAEQDWSEGRGEPEKGVRTAF